jgi:hypothetical protein
VSEEVQVLEVEETLENMTDNEAEISVHSGDEDVDSESDENGDPEFNPNEQYDSDASF